MGEIIFIFLFRLKIWRFLRIICIFVYNLLILFYLSIRKQIRKRIFCIVFAYYLYFLKEILLFLNKIVGN